MSTLEREIGLAPDPDYHPLLTAFMFGTGQMTEGEIDQFLNDEIEKKRERFKLWGTGEALDYAISACRGLVYLWKDRNPATMQCATDAVNPDRDRNITCMFMLGTELASYERAEEYIDILAGCAVAQTPSLQDPIWSLTRLAPIDYGNTSHNDYKHCILGILSIGYRFGQTGVYEAGFGS